MRESKVPDAIPLSKGILENIEKEKAAIDKKLDEYYVKFIEAINTAIASGKYKTTPSGLIIVTVTIDNVTEYSDELKTLNFSLIRHYQNAGWDVQLISHINHPSTDLSGLMMSLRPDTEEAEDKGTSNAFDFMDAPFKFFNCIRKICRKGKGERGMSENNGTYKRIDSNRRR